MLRLQDSLVAPILDELNNSVQVLGIAMRMLRGYKLGLCGDKAQAFRERCESLVARIEHPEGILFQRGHKREYAAIWCDENGGGAPMN